VLFLGSNSAVDPGPYLESWRHVASLAFPVAAGWVPRSPDRSPRRPRGGPDRRRRHLDGRSRPGVAAPRRPSEAEWLTATGRSSRVRSGCRRPRP
jgi:hypothetical protein